MTIYYEARVSRSRRAPVLRRVHNCVVRNDRLVLKSALLDSKSK